jgi:membrane protein implicated in regulation of membrane protease activity
MDYWMSLMFLAAGILLAVAEMATVTFYLAALSFAALITALYTWLYASAWWQAAVVFALASVVMLPLAHLLRGAMQAGARNEHLSDMDRGGIVVIAEDAGGALRVKYRDSLWEADWEGAGRPEVGARAEVVARDGSRLRIRSIGQPASGASSGAA